MTNKKAGWYLNVHPVFRILCFIILSLAMVLGGIAQLCLAIVLVAVLFASVDAQVLKNALLAVRHLRWLLLSLVLIYGWLTPGAALFGLDHIWGMPSAIGLFQGAQRLLILIVIVMAVHWLLWVTPRAQLVGALYWLLAPMRVLGLRRESLALRISLVLERVPRVQNMIEEQLSVTSVRKRDVKAYASVLVGLIIKLIAQADNDPLREVEIDISDSPPLVQFVWPLGLGLSMLLVGWLLNPIFSG